MLRPSKLFVSFHQLRHFFQTRLSELAHPVNNQSLARFTQQPNLQQFFTHIFHQSFASPPTVAPGQAKLLKVLQHHFPVVKVFSNPTCTVRRPHLGLWTGQQSRTMMSGTPWNFPRQAGRNPVRQFSTSKPVFQNAHSPNPLSHVSRIFSPVGTKINTTQADESKPTTAKSSLLNKQGGKEEMPNFHRVFGPRNGGMRELIDEDDQHCVHQLNTKKQSKRQRQEKLKDIIQHDALSSPCKKGPDKILLQSERDLLQTLRHEESLHLSITLDILHFLNGGVMDESFIRSIEELHHRYQIHMHHVLNLLQRLQPHLERAFRAVIEQGELKIEFLSPVPQNKQEAIRLLETLGVFPQHVLVNTTVGLDYFNDIQVFIDRIDTLIDHGPAFKRNIVK